MKFEDIPGTIISYEIIKYLNLKDIIRLKMSSKKNNDIIKDDNNAFKIINISGRETESVLKQLETTHSMNMKDNTYIVCTMGNQIFYAYIPNDLKKKFINSKLLIMNGS